MGVDGDRTCRPEITSRDRLKISSRRLISRLIRAEQCAVDFTAADEKGRKEAGRKVRPRFRGATDIILIMSVRFYSISKGGHLDRAIYHALH